MVSLFERTFVLILSLALTGVPADACTSFLAGPAGHSIIGKSYDWDDSTGMLMINPRGVAKTALSFDKHDTPATWTARYASATFNQFGLELPLGGINEKKLVAEITWLGSSRYPSWLEDKRPIVNQSQWVQYILDTSATLDEAIVNARKVRVVAVLAMNVHYLVCDAASKCAVFEYIDRKLTISRGKQVRAITNNTFHDSSAELAQYQGFGGDRKIPAQSNESLLRYVIANQGAVKLSSAPQVADGFALLDRVHQKGYTKWNIIYDQATLTISYRTTDNWQMKTVAVAKFFGDCEVNQAQQASRGLNQPVRMLDINRKDLSGDISSQLKPYGEAAAREILKSNESYQQLPQLLEVALRYPRESTQCQRIHAVSR